MVGKTVTCPFCGTAAAGGSRIVCPVCGAFAGAGDTPDAAEKSVFTAVSAVERSRYDTRLVENWPDGGYCLWAKFVGTQENY